MMTTPAKKAALALPVLLTLILAGCGDDGSGQDDPSTAPRDVGTSSGSDLPQDESTADSDAAQQTLLVSWCQAKSGRDEASCSCILSTVKSTMQAGDYLILAEVAAADLEDGATEEAIEARFDEKYGAERMNALMDAFTKTRAEAEQACSAQPRGTPNPQGT